ncbi:MAG TPA: hypothetical protein VM433_08285 [Mycobacteriales bacterium]|nr:hypothetical protein [Mycobacteriales bacterium]
MDFPLLLLVLLALPFVVAAVIVAVSVIRRRRSAEAHGPATEPVHRGQADTAAVQSAAVHPPAAGRRVRAGRERRAASAGRLPDA